MEQLYSLLHLLIIYKLLLTARITDAVNQNSCINNDLPETDNIINRNFYEKQPRTNGEEFFGRLENETLY